MNILKSKCNRTLSSDKGKIRGQISGLTKIHESQYYTIYRGLKLGNNPSFIQQYHNKLE